VNLMRRTNDLPIADPAALYNDAAARDSITRMGWIATGPGGLAEAERAVPVNEVYNTNLRLIFYDDPPFGPYQGWFNQIFSEPRYTNLSVNLRHFERVYATILARRAAAGQSASSGDQAAFNTRYYDTIAAEKARLDQSIVVLSANSGQKS
jgi:hypothetical protein